MSTFQDRPRDYALELVENGQVDHNTMLIACLKYMSHDDVRGMLSANELAPHCCEDCEAEMDDDENEYCEDCTIERFLDDHKYGYDVDAMRADIENGNMEVGNDASEYEHETIVFNSLTNGQFDQAKEQCERFTLDYATQLAEFNADSEGA